MQEQQILDTCTQRFLNGTPTQVATSLEELHARTDVDEIMLTVMGPSRQSQARTVDLLADHYGMPDLGA